MVIDTSALLAILLEEPDAKAVAEVMTRSGIRLMSASAVLESGIVLLARKGEQAFFALDQLIVDFSIQIAPFDHAQARLARAAYVRFGKGRHRAALNFGDCISYALAKSEAMPLLFKGDDFRLTDIEAAL